MMNIPIVGISCAVGCMIGMWWNHHVNEMLVKDNDDLRENNNALKKQLKAALEISETRQKAISELSEELKLYKSSELDVTQFAYIQRENERLDAANRKLVERCATAEQQAHTAREQLITTHTALMAAYSELDWRDGRDEVIRQAQKEATE